MTPVPSRLTQRVAATVVTAGSRKASHDSAPGAFAALDDSELARLTAWRERNPVALVEHLADGQLARIRFERWLSLSGRRSE